MRGGSRKGAGRPAGSTGKELKKAFTVRAYPSDVNDLKKKDKTLQKAVDRGVGLLLISDGWSIEFNLKPGKDRRHDYDFWHEDYDGAEDGNHLRGTAESIADAIKQISEIERVR